MKCGVLPSFISGDISCSVRESAQQCSCRRLLECRLLADVGENVVGNMANGHSWLRPECSATWRITVNNSLRRRPQYCICVRPITWKRDVIHETGSTQCIASEDERATVTGKRAEKFVKFGHVHFGICERTDKRTHRPTQKHAIRNTSHPSRALILFKISALYKSFTYLLHLHCQKIVKNLCQKPDSFSTANHSIAKVRL